MLNHLIDFEHDDLKKSIFRVFSIERLIVMCTTRQNTLVRPKKWDDPFENFILTKALELEEAEPWRGLQNSFYGQCWTRRKESDAMWRIYSPEKNGVKVRSTVGKLLESLKTALQGNGECFIGRVSYLRDDELRKNLKDATWLRDDIASLESMARSLLFKRREFDHEREVRLIYMKSDVTGDDLFRYPIDPLELFDEIQFDPRISNEMFVVYKHYLETEVGYKKLINKSPLYQLPQLELKKA